VNDAWYDGTIWQFVWGLAWEAFQAGRNFEKELSDELRPEYNLEELKPVVWEQALMYKHRGEKIVRFEILGRCTGVTQMAAKETGKELAEKWLKEKFPKPEDVEFWESKVRRVGTE
jgi:hypothetical protein